MKPSEASKKLEFHSKQICHGCIHPSMVGWCENHCQLPEAFEMAISALKKQEADRWIPVTERTPEEKDAGILKKLGTDKRSDYVLATVEVKGERMTVTACTYDGKWDWNMKYAFPDYKVLAWRPLPEPYTEEES